MSSPRFDGLQQQNFNCGHFPFLSLRLCHSQSISTHFCFSHSFFSSFYLCTLLSHLSLPPQALCVNFRIFQRVGLSWHEMGLAKETIFTTKSPSLLLCSLKANISLRKKVSRCYVQFFFSLLLILHFSDSYFVATHRFSFTGFSLRIAYSAQIRFF